MKVLVTGGNGFIGSNLVKYLISKGDQVKAMVLKGTNETNLEGVNCEIVYADVMKPETLQPILKDIEIVYHLAALTTIGWSNKIYKINFEGTKNIVRESINAGVKRIVHMSSSVVLGFKDYDGVDETTPLNKPKWYRRPYAKSKIKCELFLKEMIDKIEIVIIRPGHLVFGPNDLLQTYEISNRFEKGKIYGVINGGTAKMGYSYAENLAHGLYLGGTHENAPGNTYFIAGIDPPYISMKIFNDLLCEELGVEPSIMNVSSKLMIPVGVLIDLIYRTILRKKLPLLCTYTVKCAKYNLYFNPIKAQKELGYTQIVNLKDAIKRSVKWYREKKELLDKKK